MHPKLILFKHKHQSGFNYLFWPDLVGAHNSNETVVWMKENVDLVEKTSNCPNVPQGTPIENLWGILAQKAYEGGRQAIKQEELISRIQSKLKKLTQFFLQNLMGIVKTKLRAIADSGMLATYKK